MNKRARRPQRRLVIGLMLALAVATHASQAQTGPAEVHGSLDAFAAPGLALAWAVLRAKADAAAEVVVRVDTDPKVYGSLSVAGVDPFSKASQALVLLAPVDGTRMVRLPRSTFADLPRTEWRFYTSPTARASDTPALLVYYQGVPDTTPEFNTESQLAASLAQRIERVQHETKAK
jgi:hypothetical protein